MILWIVVRQAPLSMGLPRQKCWSGLPFPPPGDLPEPGIEPTSFVSPVLADKFFTTEQPGKPPGKAEWTQKRFFKDFFIWTIFKVFTEFVTILLLFYVFEGFMWDFRSQTRDGTPIPYIGRWSLNHWTTREVPQMRF